MPGSKGKGQGVSIEVVMAAAKWFSSRKEELHGLYVPDIARRFLADTGMKIGSRTINAMRKEYGIRSRPISSPEKSTAMKRLVVNEQNVEKLIQIANLLADTIESLGENSAARQIRQLLSPQ